jgi:hypothetical protein
MALTNAERQRAYRERHFAKGTKSRLEFVLDAGTKAKLYRLARHKGCTAISLIDEWAGSAERRVTSRLSDKALKAYYDGE